MLLGRYSGRRHAWRHVHSESEELVSWTSPCPGFLGSKTCWGQRAEELGFVSLGGQTRDSLWARLIPFDCQRQVGDSQD